MRVHQPGGHLMRGGRAEVEDWSWAQTKRRLTRAVPACETVQEPDRDRDRLAARRDRCQPRAAVPRRPGRGRGEQRPHEHPRLARRCVRRGRRGRHRGQLRADLLHRLDGRADARRPPQPSLPPSAAAVARLLRAKPCGRDHQPPDERRRGARPARHRRRHLARAEHPDARRHGGDPLLPRLAARARHADGDAGHGVGDRMVPQALGPRLPRRARDARRRHRDARRGHRRHARSAVVHP